LYILCLYFTGFVQFVKRFVQFLSSSNLVEGRIVSELSLVFQSEILRTEILKSIKYFTFW
jgi:hypothetical protein